MNRVFGRIVVATDFSACSTHAWQLAQRLATALGSELILAHVFVEGTLWSESPFNKERLRELFADGRRTVSDTLDEWATTARSAGLTVVMAVRDGIPYHEIVALAQDKQADLIVIGTHGRGGVNRALLGSVADRVVRLAPCPVLTVREPS